jgi:hypothetical protein
LQSPAEPGFGVFGGVQSRIIFDVRMQHRRIFPCGGARADRAHPNRIRFNELPAKTLIDAEAAALDGRNLFGTRQIFTPVMIIFFARNAIR